MAYAQKIKKSKQIDKSGFIRTNYNPKGYYEIIYFDKNGMSILAKTKYKTTAIVFAEKYAKDLNEGKLLKEDKSIYKYK